MATLKEFEEALREHGMVNALAILAELKKRDRETRSVAPARRVVGRKMTAELARTVIEMHATTGMTQQEIAFKLGVNQGRVNEVIKRGKWLSGDPSAPEALSRDKAMVRLDQRAKSRRQSAAPTASNQRLPEAESAPNLPGAVRATAGRASTQLPARSFPHSDPNGELPLSGSAAVKSVAPTVGLKPNPRRQDDPPMPIVSAQLAFLDL